MNGLYMTVNNPLPTSALSPPMAPLASPFNMPQQSQVYYEESLQPDDLANKQMLGTLGHWSLLSDGRPVSAMRQLSQNRQQFQRFKKNGDDLSEEMAMKADYPKQTMKNMTSISLNQNAISKNIPFNYPLYISPASVASHNQSQMFINNNSINSNSFNHYPTNFQTQVTDYHCYFG